MLLHFWLVSTGVLAGVECAARRIKDSQTSANVIELDALDPRNQAVHSSYSIVETSGSASGPSRVKYSRSEYEPSGQNSEPKKKLVKTKERKAKPASIDDIVNDKEAKKSATSDDLKKEGSILNSKLGDGYEEGFDQEKHYDKEGGKKYVEAHKSEAGEKAQQGFKKEEGYDKAENEKHGKEEKKAVVSEKEGEKKGHLEQEKQYGEEYKGNHGEKGISVTKKGGHKKGHKKSGFHKVHHKDEYKKDEVFYDEAHDGDEREEHAHEQEKHHKEKGGQAKKNHIDSAYHEGHGEKKGVQNKGHHFEEAAGHKKEAGQEAHHDQHSEYGKKGGIKEGEKHGHVEGGGHEGGYADHDFF